MLVYVSLDFRFNLVFRKISLVHDYEISPTSNIRSWISTEHSRVTRIINTVIKFAMLSLKPSVHPLLASWSSYIPPTGYSNGLINSQLYRYWTMLTWRCISLRSKISHHFSWRFRSPDETRHTILIIYL